MDLDARDKRWRSHRWSGYPGSYCQDCFLDDPLEQAVADNLEDTDKWDCTECQAGKE